MGRPHFHVKIYVKFWGQVEIVGDKPSYRCKYWNYCNYYSEVCMPVGAHSPIQHCYSFNAEYQGDEKNEHSTNHMEPHWRFVPRFQVPHCSDLPETENSPSNPEHPTMKEEIYDSRPIVHPPVTFTCCREMNNQKASISWGMIHNFMCLVRVCVVYVKILILLTY